MFGVLPDSHLYQSSSTSVLFVHDPFMNYREERVLLLLSAEPHPTGEDRQSPKGVVKCLI